MMGVSKYFTFAKASFKTHCGHSLKLVLRFLICCFFMVVFIEMWRLIDRENLLDLPYTITDIAWYTSLTQMLLFLSPRLFMVIDDDVRSGNIAYFLIRPIPYLWMRLSEGVGALTVHIILYYTVGVLFLWLYIGTFPTGGIASLGIALFFVYMSSILYLMFQLIVGITALWIQEAEPTYRIFQKLFIVLGGLYMPLSMYPNWVEKMASFTPFYTMMYLAIKPILGGEITLLSIMTIVGHFVIWFTIAFFLMGWIYRVCVRRLEVNGG